MSVVVYIYPLSVYLKLAIYEKSFLLILIISLISFLLYKILSKKYIYTTHPYLLKLLQVAEILLIILFQNGKAP